MGRPKPFLGPPPTSSAGFWPVVGRRWRWRPIERDYIHVADVARGVAALVAATETGDIGPGSTELNLGTGIPTTTLELARILLDLAGVEADGLSPVVSEPTRDPVSLVVDPARLIAATGFRPSIPLATGLAEEMAWLRSHPELWVEERAK